MACSDDQRRSTYTSTGIAAGPRLSLFSRFAGASLSRNGSIELLPSGGRGGKPLKWVFYLVVVVLGLALLLPDLIEPRVRMGERSALQSVKAFKAAQEAYKRALGTFAPTVDCLVRPRSCAPTYQGGAFLHEAYAAERRDGYVFELVGSPRDPSRAAFSYALFANPAQPGKTGVRSFCADSAGRLCFGRKELRPVSDSAVCPAACEHDIAP
jgi:hypothetical protein